LPPAAGHPVRDLDDVARVRGRRGSRSSRRGVATPSPARAPARATRADADPAPQPAIERPGGERTMSALVHRERPANGNPRGLHHGRGADEPDLLGLADVLDPERRLQVVTPRAPLTIEGWPGHHWYMVPRVGYPDPATFHAAYRTLAEFHDELWRRTGVVPA